tara:strand:- start:3840 stop:4253 length:414 start_codon:yes stop_codon:yes gene_type:complete
MAFKSHKINNFTQKYKKQLIDFNQEREIQKKESEQIQEETEKKITLTEFQTKRLDENREDFPYKFDVYLKNTAFLIQELETNKDYKDGNMLYVPMDIKDEYRNEYSGCKYLVEIFCIEDKNILKRANKIYQKYNLLK